MRTGGAAFPGFRESRQADAGRVSQFLIRELEPLRFLERHEVEEHPHGWRLLARHARQPRAGGEDVHQVRHQEDDDIAGCEREFLGEPFEPRYRAGWQSG